MLVFSQLCFSELTQDTTHQMKLIKLTEDAITDDSYKPIAGKEKLLAVKVVDESGKGVFGAEVKFEIVAGDGELIGSTTNQVSKRSVTETSAFNGTIGIIMTVDSKPQIINKVKATLLSDETQNVEFVFQAIELPKDLENRNLLLEVCKNDWKLHENCIEEWETESDAFWTTGPEWQKKGNKNIQRVRRTRKGNNVKMEITHPVVKVTGRKDKGILTPVRAPDLEKIAYNEVTKVIILIHRNNNKNKLTDFELTYVDIERMVITKEERMRIKENCIFKRYLTEYNNWNKYLELGNIWGAMEQTEKTFADYDKLTETTIRVYTKRQINQKIKDSEFDGLKGGDN